MYSSLIDKYFIKKPKFRRFVTKMLNGDRLVRVNLFGGNILISTLKEHGYLRAARISAHSSLLRDEYPVMLTMSNLVTDNCAFIDVGANVGIYSCTFSKFKKIHKDFQVLAFEVDPDTFNRLELNGKEYGFKTFNCGIGKTSDKVDFVSGAVSHVTTRVNLANSYSIHAETFLAEIKPLSDFDLPQRLIIKIDVEGQELDVLEGARKYFDSGRVICVYLDGYGDKSCWEFLEKYGFDFFDGKSLEKAERSTFSLLALKPQ
jgi:FkbM family methyltransferase